VLDGGTRCITCDPGFYYDDGNGCMMCTVCQETTFVLYACNRTFDTVSFRLFCFQLFAFGSFAFGSFAFDT